MQWAGMLASDDAVAAGCSGSAGSSSGSVLLLGCSQDLLGLKHRLHWVTRLFLSQHRSSTPVFQPCHCHFPSSAFLVERRGICVHPVLSVVAPAVHRVGPPAREPGQCAMSLVPTSPHYPLLLILLILSTADLAPSVVSVSPPSLLPLPLISPLPLLLCVFFMCIAFFHVTFVLWGGKSCLPASLCSNRSCPSDGFFW